MTTSLSYKKLYTMVEIMMVLAIISVLAMIAAPNFVKNREAANDSQKQANIRIVQMAKEQWKMDNPGVDGSVLTLDQIKGYIPNVDSHEDLKVDGDYISIGGVNENPTYSVVTQF